jgi:hypothetical protein
MLAALDIPADILIELVRGGLVIARRETVVEEDSADEVTPRRALGARAIRLTAAARLRVCPVRNAMTSSAIAWPLLIAALTLA